MKNQSVLSNIARTHSQYLVRAEAVQKLTDQAVVKEVALNDPEIRVRQAAIYTLEDPLLLTKIATSDPDKYIRAAAIDKLTDQTILKEIVLSDSETLLRHIALKEPPGDSRQEMEKSSTVNVLRRAALMGLDSNEQTIFIDIAKNNPHANLRKTAVNRITDQTILTEIIKNDTDKDVRVRAVMGIIDKDILVNIINDESLSDLHYRASHALKDIDMLADLAKNHPNSSMRRMLSRVSVVRIAGGLFNKNQPVKGSTIYLIPIKNGSTSLKYSNGKVINENDKSDQYGRFTLWVDLDEYLEYEEFTIGLVAQNRVYSLTTQDGTYIQLQFEGKDFQDINLGKIYIK